MDEEAKLGVLESKLAPDSLKEHFAAEGDKYKTYKDMKTKIENYLAETEGIYDDPMEVNAVNKGKGKGKGKEKGKQQQQQRQVTPRWQQ